MIGAMGGFQERDAHGTGGPSVVGHHGSPKKEARLVSFELKAQLSANVKSVRLKAEEELYLMVKGVNGRGQLAFSQGEHKDAAKYYGQAIQMMREARAMGNTALLKLLFWTFLKQFFRIINFLISCFARVTL